MTTTKTILNLFHRVLAQWIIIAIICKTCLISRHQHSFLVIHSYFIFSLFPPLYPLPTCSLSLSPSSLPPGILLLAISNIIPCSKAPNFFDLPHIYCWRLHWLTHWDLESICVSALISSLLYFKMSTTLSSPPWYPFFLNSYLLLISVASFHTHICYLRS